jgi:hypothetical protein
MYQHRSSDSGSKPIDTCGIRRQIESQTEADVGQHIQAAEAPLLLQLPVS